MLGCIYTAGYLINQTVFQFGLSPCKTKVPAGGSNSNLVPDDTK